MTMPSTTHYSYGDIVLVAFPFTHHKTTKKRPAAIISSANYQRTRPDVILMAITSQVRNPTSPNEAILQDWETAGLLKPSMLKPLVATVDKRCVLKKLGQLSAVDRELLGHVIEQIFGN